ncbi:copper oxidase, partial [Agrobacterium vitis]|nr:copper oxidase [Allorhizobium ampelinum]
MKTLLTVVLTAFLATSALASGTHEGGHDAAMAVGEPGKKAEATQTIRVSMKETA